MTTSVSFPQPKDPRDTAWYTITFGEPLATLVGVTITVSVPVLPYLAVYTTAGDDPTGCTDLIGSNAQLTLDSLGVAVLLANGIPGKSYAVCANVVTATGSTIDRSAILFVTGL